VLVAYSDGVIEARTAAGAWATLDDLAACISGDGTEDVEAVAERCFGFRGSLADDKRADDITVVVVAAD
jgi:serine phosphatase RsbU (regulator of sigma subunit)